jgi:glyoxalase family protein
VGFGLAVEVSLEVPPDSLEFWAARLEKYGTPLQAVESRFGDRVLPLIDPHGLRVALVESGRPAARKAAPWSGSPVPPERQVRGLYGARAFERSLAPTATFLANTLGFERLGEQDGWTRYGFQGEAGHLDLRERPDLRPGAWGVGCVHHLAWRVDDETHQLAVRAQVEEAGGRATEVIDRFWFKSVYFREPGGVLFELATDGPGFAIDEDSEHLGEALVLPPFLQSRRAEIERLLPPLNLPEPARAEPRA